MDPEIPGLQIARAYRANQQCAFADNDGVGDVPIVGKLQRSHSGLLILQLVQRPNLRAARNNKRVMSDSPQDLGGPGHDVVVVRPGSVVAGNEQAMNMGLRVIGGRRGPPKHALNKGDGVAEGGARARARLFPDSSGGSGHRVPLFAKYWVILATWPSKTPMKATPVKTFICVRYPYELRIKAQSLDRAVSSGL